MNTADIPFNNTRQKTSHKRDVRLQVARAVCHEIERDLAAPYSVRKFAEHFNMSVTSLNEHFRDIYGLTIPSYIRQRRMEEAAKLIGEGNIAITRIALQVGYTNPSKFSEAFKRTFGVKPSEYRRSVHGNSQNKSSHSSSE